MRNIFKNIILSIILVGATSCSGFLEELPDGTISVDEIRNMDDLEQILVSVYSPLKVICAGGTVLYPEIQTDYVYSVIGYTNTAGSIYTWNFNPESSEVSSVWNNCWNGISRANFLLENAYRANPNESEQERYNEILGETHFIRTLLYSEMIKTYSDPYGRNLGGSSADPNKQLGLPIFNETGIVTQRRASMYDYYQNMFNDLAIAEANITRTGTDDVYVTKGAVRALRARLYLYMEDWENAEKEASFLIDSCDYRLMDAKAGDSSEYAHMWEYDEGDEIIFKISYSRTDLGGAMGSLFWMQAAGKFTPDYVPATWVLKLYEEDDARYNVFFSEEQTAYQHELKWPLLKKYPGNPDLWTSSVTNYTNMPKVFRLSEMYLIRAESRLEQGNESGASDDLNTLRKARIASPDPIENVRKTLENERVRELYMEGHRLYDLKRWGVGFERTPQESTVYPGNDEKISSDDVFFTWPIPASELNVPNSEVVGNPSNYAQ
ncbi:MAG: RagB/SusD family nutrient uptake outer membrane protein [Mangrovibacterium sp.]